MRWVSPPAGAIYRRAPSLPPEAQRLLVELHWTGGRVPRSVRVEIDGQPWMEWTSPPYRAWWLLIPGAHVFQATAELEEGEVIPAPPLRIEVR